MRGEYYLKGEPALGDLPVMPGPAHPLQDAPLGPGDGLHLQRVPVLANQGPGPGDQSEASIESIDQSEASVTWRPDCRPSPVCPPWPRPLGMSASASTLSCKYSGHVTSLGPIRGQYLCHMI